MRVCEIEKYFAYLLFAFSLYPPIGFAQTDTSGHTSVTCLVEHDAMTFVKGAGHIFSAPARWDSGDWMMAGGTAVVSVASAGLDNDAAAFMRRNQSPLNDKLEKAGTAYGDGVVIGGVVAGGYIVSLLIRDDWLRETTLLAGSAIIYSATISTVTKMVVGRARPYMDQGHGEFKPFIGDEGNWSFPSGHTIVAFSFSSVLAARIKNPWATVGLYSAAGLCSASRMYSRNHWLSDVVFGALYASAIGRSLVSWQEGNDASRPEPGWSVMPTSEGIGIRIRL